MTRRVLNRLSQRFAQRFAFALALASSVTACELAFDFDRTPLQPVYEGGAGQPDAGSDSGAIQEGGSHG